MYIATAVGLFIAAFSEGEWRIIKHVLPDTPLTSIAVTEDVIVAGTADGLLRSTDTGKSWTTVNGPIANVHVRWLDHLVAVPTTFLAGTEPAGIWVSRDGGESWADRKEVGSLRDTLGWFLPYSPESGCVRGFAVATAAPNPGRVYVAVEVGGVLISDDAAYTWRLADGSDGNPDFARELGTLVHPDVHSIVVHPSSSDLVFAPTGGGLYRSTDGGKAWYMIYRCYIRAVWVDPSDPNHIIAGPADGVSRNGRIEESFDGGSTWQDASDGTAAPWPRVMVERFAHSDTEIFAVLSNGELWSKPAADRSWRRTLSQVGRVRAVAVSR